MAGISSLGVGSGLDLRSLVDNLIQAEAQAPVRRLDSLEQRLTLDLSGYGLLSSALADFNASLKALSDTDQFLKYSAVSSEPSAYTAKASAGVTPGTYSVEVTSLPSAHQVARLAVKGPFLGGLGLFGPPIDDASDVVGGGELKISVAGNETNVVIPDGSSLNDIRTLINSSGAGVTAAVEDQGTTVDLKITSNEPGSENVIAIEVVTDSELFPSDESGLSQFEYVPSNPYVPGLADGTDPGYVAESQAAQDYEILFNGESKTSSDGFFEDVIPGLDLSATNLTTGTQTLTVSVDKGAVQGSIQAFVDSFNALQTTLDELGFSDIETGEKGALVGESILRNIETQLRRGVFTQVDGQPAGLDYLSLAGIGFDDKGKLQIDQDRLDAALDSDFESVASLFSGENGVASVLEDQISGYLGSGGLLAQRTTSLNEQIADIGDERDNLAFRLEKLEARLVSRFSALDALVSQLNNTGEYLIQQLTNINSIVTKPASGSR